ncbi:hypothetical protein HOY80DRAFT_1138494 [Tuber brumale]|nr:hypothetical protein HOY80DRAFT_1138494 [Tuber brumale]
MIGYDSTVPGMQKKKSHRNCMGGDNHGGGRMLFCAILSNNQSTCLFLIFNFHYFPFECRYRYRYLVILFNGYLRLSFVVSSWPAILTKGPNHGKGKRQREGKKEKEKEDFMSSRY